MSADGERIGGIDHPCGIAGRGGRAVVDLDVKGVHLLCDGGIRVAEWASVSNHMDLGDHGPLYMY